MSFPIHLRYDGEIHPVALPLFADTTRSRMWWQALAYVNKVLAPSKRSFTLFDEEFAIRYQDGHPQQHDLYPLLEALRHGLGPYPAITHRRAA